MNKAVQQLAMANCVTKPLSTFPVCGK